MSLWSAILVSRSSSWGPQLPRQTRLGAWLVAGTGSFGTEVIEVTEADAIVKTGAEGVFCAALPKLGLGVALGLAGETNNAVALFHEVMDSAPTSAAGLECLRELGALYQRLEDYRRSVIWYQRYLDLGSATADQNAIRLELARVLLKIQLYEEAIRIFSKLMENGAPEPHLGLAEALE